MLKVSGNGKKPLNAPEKPNDCVKVLAPPTLPKWWQVGTRSGRIVEGEEPDCLTIRRLHNIAVGEQSQFGATEQSGGFTIDVEEG